MKRIVIDWIQTIFGFRKFILMLGLLAAGIVLRVYGLVNGAELVDLLKTTAIAFMTSNGVEHVVGAINNYNNSPESPKNEEKEVPN